MATISVRVVPNAKIDTVAGDYRGAIKIKLRAPAVEGKANAALITFLSKRLKIPARQILLERGHKARNKVILIDTLGEDELRRRLLRA